MTDETKKERQLRLAREATARWRQRNLEASREAHRIGQRRWRENNPEKAREVSARAQVTWRGKLKSTPEGHLRESLYRAKSRAKKNGLDFDLVVGDLLPAPAVCPVLGVPLVYGYGRGRGGHRDDSPSLDRLDPAKGYVKGNVWVISMRANTLKRDATLGELKKLVAALERHG